MIKKIFYRSSIPDRTVQDTFLFSVRDLFIVAGLLFFVSVCSFAQDTTEVHQETVLIPDSTLEIDSVLISGNEHTQEMVILREMSLKPGIRITSEALQYDQARIYSVGLFTQVELTVLPKSQEKANILVHVNERWYLVPFPVFGIKEGDWHKAYFGLGLVHNNFRGRNEKVYLVGVAGYDPWGAIAYRNPFLDSSGAYYYDGRLSYNRVRNKSTAVLVNPADQFDEIHFTFSNSIGKRWDNYNTGWIFAEYDMVDISGYDHNTTISSSGIDRFFVFGAGYSYDTRDLAEFPGSGAFARASVTKYGFPGKELDNVRYGLDVREYLPVVDGLVSASRATTNLMAGSISPSYNHVYTGYDYRIRGHYSEVIEGEDMLGVSTELRLTILSPRYYKTNRLPSQFGVWRFAVAFAVFGDAGMVWFRHTPVALNRFVKGYGAGIDFLLPYSFVLRMEYALNEVRHGQFIFDLGAAF
jgi:outer membrane protein assembly factor BamA